VVQAVIKAHQGRFSIESPEQGGAIATLRLPQLRNRN
jgi:two-component system sensor histidine kinase FlrB